MKRSRAAAFDVAAPEIDGGLDQAPGGSRSACSQAEQAERVVVTRETVKSAPEQRHLTQPAAPRKLRHGV